MFAKAKLFLFAAVLVFLPVFKNNASDNTMSKELLKVGDKAPDFTIGGQDGSQFHLYGNIGKKNIILYFYPLDESGGCTKEACSFRDNYTDFIVRQREQSAANVWGAQ